MKSSVGSSLPDGYETLICTFCHHRAAKRGLRVALIYRTNLWPSRAWTQTEIYMSALELIICETNLSSRAPARLASVAPTSPRFVFNLARASQLLRGADQINN